MANTKEGPKIASTVATCPKCGRIMTLNVPEYSGFSVSEGWKRLASDHASKFGCDWPSSHLDKLPK